MTEDQWEDAILGNLLKSYYLDYDHSYAQKRSFNNFVEHRIGKIIDEESTFQKLTEKDEEVQQLLAQQDRVLNGTDGALLLSVNIDTGKIQDRVELPVLPGWDSLAGAEGKLFLSTLDGSVICFGSESE